MAKEKRGAARGSRAGEGPAEAQPESVDIPPAPPSYDLDGDPIGAARGRSEGSGPRSEETGDRPRAAWGDPIARFERRWTDLESKLITLVLLGEILVLVAWVFLVGLSSPVKAGNAAGMVFRAVAGAVVLGLAAKVATERLWGAGRAAPNGQGAGASRKQTAIILVAVALGLIIAPAWRGTGVEYFDNVKGWLQEGSTLTLMGGLRGLATRLTLWLALLGASLATAAGKHIHIDVVFRFLPAKLRLPAAVVNFVAAALVCLGAVWGFFDHIAIESYGAQSGDSAAAKIERARAEIGEHLFLTRKQIGLDLRSLPHVLKGERYDTWMPAREWNAWLADGAFEPRFTADQVKSLVVPEDGPAHPPLVLSPDGEVTRGVLVSDLSLVFPFGFMVLALRFLLRALLTLSGHIPIDPDAAHKEEFGDPKHRAPLDEAESEQDEAARGGA